MLADLGRGHPLMMPVIAWAGQDSLTTVGGMVVVVGHEPSALFLGEGFVLVDRANALEFEDVRTAQVFLDRYASEPCFVAGDVAQSAA
jgi:hypothetical protein